MSIRSTTSAAFNVGLGWLGVDVPPVAKHRRRPYRKTKRQQTPKLIRRLEAAGCEPREAGDGMWIALCPTCRADGRHALVEIRRSEDGTLLMACIDGHEPARRAA